MKANDAPLHRESPSTSSGRHRKISQTLGNTYRHAYIARRILVETTLLNFHRRQTVSRFLYEIGQVST